MLLGMKAAADLIGMPYTSFRKAARAEGLDVFKIAGRFYVRRKDLEPFVERQLVGRGAAA